MARQHIKVYLTDDWMIAIEKAKGDKSQSNWVRDCIKKELRRSGMKDVAKRLSAIKPGRPYDN